VDRLPGWDEGTYWVQDEAAQVAAELVGASPGQRVLDACAAPGGKSVYLAHQVGGDGEIVATDSDPRRLTMVDGATGRLGLAQVRTVARNWVEQPFGALEDDASFDAVLIDAPCSGLGVIRRHPDIRFARRRGDLARYADRQLALLKALAPAVRPGGRLVYAVCTFSEAETTGVLERARAEGVLDDYETQSVHLLRPDLPEGAVWDGALRTLPHRDQSDAFFAVALGRRLR
ncbi:MAG: RsmB/NOP family class I SAM-dependent RNA methyltransferase, partial [Deltaproteobacteria bacterium]|nr:RsmB/NOP family class I SAM-dependent RNA methyltransferase [Deltaproteobacteria bacterium]